MGGLREGKKGKWMDGERVLVMDGLMDREREIGMNGWIDR